VGIPQFGPGKRTHGGGKKSAEGALEKAKRDTRVDQESTARKGATREKKKRGEESKGANQQQNTSEEKTGSGGVSRP